MSLTQKQHHFLNAFFEEYDKFFPDGKWWIFSSETRKNWRDHKTWPHRSNVEEVLAQAHELKPSFPHEKLLKLYDEANQVTPRPPIHEVMSVYRGEEGYVSTFNSWCETAKDVVILQSWMTHATLFPANLIERVQEKEVCVRLLLLHPESPNAQQRIRDSGSTVTDLKYALEKLERTIKRHSLFDYPENFCLRFYKGLPSFAAYIADNDILLTQFWFHEKTSEGPHQHIRVNNDYGRWIRNSVERLWEYNETGDDVNLKEFRAESYKVGN
jgi:hypothetical protein